jgi:AraC-like DNA-binding protein
MLFDAFSIGRGRSDGDALFGKALALFGNSIILQKGGRLMRNGCARAEQPACLPRMTLQTVWYVEADATYQVTRRMMVLQGGDWVALRTLGGAGVMRLTNDRLLTLPQGSLVLIPKERIAFYGCKGEQWRFYWLEFATDAPPDFQREAVLPIPAAIGEEHELQRCFDMLRGKAGSAMAALAQALFLCRMADWRCRSMSDATEERRQTDAIILLLSQGVREHLSVAQLAKRACLCERSFRTLVKRMVGKTPKQYMLEDRLASAFMLLRTTDRSVCDIALSLGFMSAAYFTHAFHSYYGLSPTQARRIEAAAILPPGAGQLSIKAT